MIYWSTEIDQTLIDNSLNIFFGEEVGKAHFMENTLKRKLVWEEATWIQEEFVQSTYDLRCVMVQKYYFNYICDTNNFYDIFLFADLTWLPGNISNFQWYCNG